VFAEHGWKHAVEGFPDKKQFIGKAKHLSHPGSAGSVASGNKYRFHPPPMLQCAAGIIAKSSVFEQRRNLPDPGVVA
jgi:hypothetical protein